MLNYGVLTIGLNSGDRIVLQKIDGLTAKQNPRLPEYKLCWKNYKGL